MTRPSTRGALELVLVAAAFLLLAALLCAPAMPRLGELGIGDAEHPLFHGDIYVSTVIESSVREGRLLRWYDTLRVNHPVGERLMPSIVHSLNPYLSLPFHLLFEPVAAHNLVALLVLAFNGFAMYLVARDLLRSRSLGFAAGVVFAFNSYPMLKIGMGAIHKSILGFLPLFLWALHRWGQRPDAKRLLLVSLALQLVYQQYPLYALYALMVVPLYLAWDLARGRGLRLVGPAAALVLVFVVLTYASDLLLGFSATHSNLAFLPQPQVFAEPNGYFDILHPLRAWLPEPTGLPVGLPALVLPLALIAAWRGRGFPRFLVVLALVFLVLSAGPFLMRDGAPVLLGGQPVPLPYRLLDLAVPATYGRSLTFPLRTLTVVMMSLSLLAGYGLRLLSGPGRARWLLVAGFLVLHLGEHLLRFPELFPVPATPAPVPSIFEEIAQEEGGVLLHLPLAQRKDRILSHRYCFLSAVADKPMVNQHEASPPALERFPGASSSPEERREALEGLRAWGVRWVVVHGDAFQPPASPAELAWLRGELGEPDFDEDGVAVYPLAPAGRPSP